MNVVFSVLVGGAFAPGWADAPNPYQDCIDKGRKFLFTAMKAEKRLGYLALGTMALIKTSPSHVEGPNKGKTKKDPELQAIIDRLVEEIDAKESEFTAGEGTYTLAVCASCLIADDAGKHERQIRKLVAKMIANQLKNGCWTYPTGSPPLGDTSQVQYIVLALWDAAVAGIEIPPRVWDSAMDWQIRTQDSTGAGGPGGFLYHPTKISEDGKPVEQGAEIATMGVAGLSTMLICQSQLPSLKKRGGSRGPMLLDELIRPAVDDPDDAGYVPKVTPEMAHAAIDRAEGWVARNSIFAGPFKDAVKVNYYLYGYERVAALKKTSPSRKESKGDDWYKTGGDFLRRSQKADGSWACGAHWDDKADTAFALLFLGKTMEKKLSKINVEVLQRSLAIGGSGGLPTADGSSGGSAFQRQYERYKTQPTSNIDDLVKIFEDPDKIVEEETAAKVEQLTADQLKELVQKVGGDSRKLRQWAYDKRPDARKAALTALAKTRDPRFAPILIDALQEKDEGVYTAAREGLRYMSRNIEVFGLPEAEKRKPELVKAGVERVREWFKNLNVEVAAFQEFTPPIP